MGCNCSEIEYKCGGKTRCKENDCSCPVIIGSECWTYEGYDLECSGIKMGTVGTELIQQLDAFICAKFDEVQNFLKIVNVGGGAEVYKGIDLLGQKELRTITKTGDLIVITENENEIDVTIDETALDTFIEANQLTYSADSVGAGADVYKNDTVVGDNTQFNFRTIVKTGDLLTVAQNTDDINLSINETNLTNFIEDLIPEDINNTYSVVNLSDGVQLYKDSTIVGDNTQFNFRTLESDTIAITQNTDKINIEVTLLELPDFIVDTRFTAETYEEKGSYAKPYKNLDNAIIAYIGSGTRLSPEFSGSRILCIGGQSHDFTENLSINNLILEVESGTTIRYTGTDLYPIDFRTLQTSAGGYGAQDRSLLIEVKGYGKIISDNLFAYVVNSGYTTSSPNFYNNRLFLSNTDIRSFYKQADFVSGITRADLSPWLSNTRTAVFYFGDVDEPCIVVEGQNGQLDNINSTSTTINNIILRSLSQQPIMVDNSRLAITEITISNENVIDSNSYVIADNADLVGNVLTEDPPGSYDLPNPKEELCLIRIKNGGRVDIQGGILSTGFSISLLEAWVKITEDASELNINNISTQIIYGGAQSTNFIETETFHPTIQIRDTTITKTLKTGATLINTTTDPFTKATINGNEFSFGVSNNIDLTKGNSASVVNTFRGKLKESIQKFPSRAGAVTAGLTQGDIFINRKTVTSGSFVAGEEYSILTIGTTDYTLIGAASNTVGLSFTASGVGTGTGTAYFYKRDIIL